MGLLCAEEPQVNAVRRQLKEERDCEDKSEEVREIVCRVKNLRDRKREPNKKMNRIQK